eukprot:5569378-Pyramimonas_sp.AAC.1
MMPPPSQGQRVSHSVGVSRSSPWRKDAASAPPQLHLPLEATFGLKRLLGPALARRLPAGAR